MKKETAKLRKNIIYLRKENKDLRDEIERLDADRRVFRTVFINNLKCALEMLGKGETWNMQYVVKELSQQMTRFERWWWG